ncbi:MAG: rfbC [Burkholderiales bacterium]|jgi:dTDP-4-dehydrorhamnose 3,5-epimerase|nr:rfbC [Burkholderiales bacterium]
MEFIKTALSGVILIKPVVHGDERGFFMESYKKSEFIKNGITTQFVQDNHSRSAYGVLRGLHYQLNPKAQAKLVRCSYGAVFDVAVDIRHGSPTYGKWVGYELSASNKNMLYIPEGFAHGFLTITAFAELLYKTNAEYSVEHDRGLAFNDPEIDIKWPEVSGGLLLSEKDKKQPSLKNIETNFYY